MSEIWNVLTEEAREIAEREPFMNAVFEGSVSESGGFGDFIAGVLANGLACDVGTKAPLRREIYRVLEDDPDLLANTEQDLKAVFERDPACSSIVLATIALKGFQALQTHRVSHALWLNCRKDLASWMAYRCSIVFGPDIHPAAKLGSGIMLDHGSGIVIGETSRVGDDVSILQGVTLGGTGKETGDRHPKVESGVMIGAGAKVIGNINLGSCSKIAAGSVVLKDVPPNCTVAGVPARIVRRHDNGLKPSLSMDQSV